LAFHSTRGAAREAARAILPGALALAVVHHRILSQDPLIIMIRNVIATTGRCRLVEL
jgi:hypothetical protein